MVLSPNLTVAVNGVNARAQRAFEILGLSLSVFSETDSRKLELHAVATNSAFSISWRATPQH